MRFKLPRESYIPKNAVKITDKLSDAVAYLSVSRSSGKPLATIFFGKQAKPVFNFYYRDEARREAAVRKIFEDRRARQALKDEARGKRLNWVPDYKVGDLFETSWGYDQTNVEYFEVIEVKGKYVTVREIARTTADDGGSYMSGKCVPLPGQFLEPRYEGDDQGVPLRRLAQERGIKICSVRWGHYCKPEIIAGVPVYKPRSYSWGH